QSVGRTAPIARRDEEPLDAIRHRLARAAAIGRDHRNAARHRLDEGRWVALAEARLQIDRAGAQLIAHLFGTHVAMHAHALVAVERGDGLDETAALGFLVPI